MQVTLDVPDDYFPERNAAAVARRLKLYAALLLFHAEELSIGAACELAEMDRYTFMAECKRHKIPVIRYSAEEVEEELKQVGGAQS